MKRMFMSSILFAAIRLAVSSGQFPHGHTNKFTSKWTIVEKAANNNIKTQRRENELFN